MIEGVTRLNIDCSYYFFYKGYMLQVNPANRPDIKEVLTGLEAIAIAMDVELKGKVVSCLGLDSLIIYIIPCVLKKAPWHLLNFWIL